MAILLNVYATVRDVPAPDFPHVLRGRRDSSDPELREHLEGFVGHVMGSRGGEISPVMFHVMLHLRRVCHHLSVEVEQADLEAFGAWAFAANAICYLPDGSVRDPAGALLFAPDGADPDADAELPYPEGAKVRRESTRQRLAERGLDVPASLPPVIDESEVELRRPWQVARRAQALFAVAVRAESLAGPDAAIDAAELRTRMPHVFDLFSPAETEFVLAEAPPEQAVFDAAWRYEALHVLLWALDVVGELPPPTAVCDVEALAGHMLALDPGTFSVEAALRPVGQILDALDEHYRLHWAVRDAGHKQAEPPAGLVSSVVLERHYALNWLVKSDDADWDDVDTPT